MKLRPRSFCSLPQVVCVLLASGIVEGETNSINAPQEINSTIARITQGHDRSAASMAERSPFNLNSALIYFEGVPPPAVQPEGVAGNTDFLAYATFGLGGPLLRLELNDLVADDILPITAPGLCELTRYQARVASIDGPFTMNTQIWSHDESNDRPMAPVLGTGVAKSGPGTGTPVVVSFLAAMPIQIPTSRFWLSYDIEGNTGGPLIANPPQLGSSVDGFSIFGDPDAGVWSGPVWFFGGCPGNPCGIFNTQFYCASTEPVGACCTHTPNSEYSCQEGVPQSTCLGRFVQDLPCEFGFDPPCGTGACCFANGTCDDIYESDCAGLNGIWHEDIFCTNADSDSCDDVCVDSCPIDPLKCLPGTCGCGVSDADSDGDGTPDCIDECDVDPNKIAAGICGCGVADTDSDGDGTPNCNDLCPLDPLKTTPGICGCGTPDINCGFDKCPFDPNKILPGICGCGVPDVDADMDGVADCLSDCDIDACPFDPNKCDPGLCGCGVSDDDTDSDTIPDCNDLCPGGDDTVDVNDDGQPDCLGAPIPTTTTWGLVAMTLFLLCGAQVLVRSIRRPCN